MAFEQFSAAVNEYNAAQFDLYRASGIRLSGLPRNRRNLPLLNAIPGPANARQRRSRGLPRIRMLTTDWHTLFLSGRRTG